MMSGLEKKYELSPIQVGMYFDGQMGDPVAYNLSASLLFKNISESHFEHALEILVAEQAALRSCIQVVNDSPVLVVKEAVTFQLRQFDFSTRRDEVSAWIKQELSQAFDLFVGPLFRVSLLKLDAHEHLFVLTLHHIIGDGVSFNIFLKKLLTYHNKLYQGHRVALERDDGFLKFIQHTHQDLMRTQYAKQKEFWVQKMDGIKPTRLPADYTSEFVSGLGLEHIFEISQERSQAIQALAQEHEITVFTLFLAVFSLLLAQYVQEEEVVFASPFSYRPDSDVEDTIGCFLRLVVLRFRIEKNTGFPQFLQQVSKEFINAYKNSDYPSNLAVDKATAASLFDINFVYDIYEEASAENVQAEIIAQEAVTFPGHLMVILNKLPNKDLLKIQYKPDLFHPSSIEKLGSSFIRLLDIVIANSQIKMDAIPSVAQSKLASPKQPIIEVKSDLSTAANPEIEQIITAVWKDVLSISDIGLDDNFFDKGGSSLTLIQVNNKLKKSNLDLSIRVQFQLPTIRMLMNYFCKKDKTQPVTRPPFSVVPRLDRGTQKITDNVESLDPEIKLRVVSRDVAIIGVSVNVPGAKSIDKFWQNLKDKKETIRYYEDKELLEMGIPKEVVLSPNYIKASGRVEGTEFFDPGFFDYAPADVRLMSPQYRLLYPGLWEAFEDAGYFPNSDPSVIGLFLSGSDDFEWYREALLNQHNYGLKYQAFTLGTNHFLATRLAYKLDIKGPVFTALSGCSSALLTPHLACQSLLLKECDIAVAGGITVELPNKGGYFYEEGMMFSADGHCRPFDAQASGTFFSNGMALVVLKRLDDAVRDKDHIYAVIKGSAVNNDGAQKLGFTAPSVQGQVEAIQKAYQVSGIDPETISYIEAHGTGTLLGDPIEIESLTQAFATPKKQFCVLGSVKGNIGHPDTAAGAVGLVKVALSFKNKYIPATANYQTPNPKIDLDNSPFVIKAEGTPWISCDAKQVLRAGINSFGVGGTNVHMVLEQAPVLVEDSPASQTNLLVFSAKTKTALLNTSKRIVQHLHQNPGLNISDAAWMLQIGRKEFTFRKTLTLQKSFYQHSETDVLQALDAEKIQEILATESPIVFMFSGQGSQYTGMLRDIYHADEPYGIGNCVKKYLKTIFNLLPEDEATVLIDILFSEENNAKINETQYSQLAIFAISYALAKTLIELGIQPNALVGHSVGEITAATVAGVFDLPDALEIVRFRGQVMQQQTPGIMLAVLQDPNSVQEALSADVWLALKNSTQNCVVGGSHDAITAFEKRCEEKEWVTARLKTSHAFHTPMMAKAAQAFQQKLVSYTLNDPKIPIVSNLTGAWVKPGEMCVHAYWVNHILKPVNFTQCLAEILKSEQGIFVEVGPGHALSTFAKQHADRVVTQNFVNLMRHPNENEHDEVYLYNKIGQLWTLGVSIDWQVIKGDAHRYRVSLPTYVFDEDYFPIDINMGPQTESRQITKNSLAVDVPTPSSQDFKTGPNKNLDVMIEAYKAVLGLKKVDAQDDFFALGGDSLKAIGVTTFVYQALRIKMDVKAVFKYPKPNELAEHLNTLMSVDLSCAIQPAVVCNHYPLSSAQKRMYTLYLLDKEGLAYNLPSATRIQGPLDKQRFERAIERLIHRHEPLRTRFAIIENVPVQMVDSAGQLSIAYTEHLDANENQIKQLITQFIKPFDLQNGPVFRVQLITLGQDDFLFLCDIHHIVADGTSLEIMARDFNQLYCSELVAPKLQYKDYSVWQAQNRQSLAMNAQKEFWLNYLTGELPVLTFPTDYTRQAIKHTAGDRIYFTLNKKLTGQLVQLAQATNTTLFMLLLSAWQILLARYSEQVDTIVGVPVAGRNLQETIDMIGMFVNILPIRNQVAEDLGFTEFLTQVKENVLNAFENQDYPFDELIQHLNINRDLGRNVLFDACFDFQNMALHDLNVDSTRFTPIQVQANTAIYDLLLTCQEDKAKENITAYIEYSTALFKPTTIERIVANLQTLLLEITQNHEVLLGDIDLVSPYERNILCETFNQNFLPIPADRGIVNLFTQNVQRMPNAVALVLPNHKTHTYAELDRASNSIAWALKNAGVKENDVVSILAQRDANLITAILGTLKAGAAFVLIDPTFPQERINHMIAQSAPKLMGYSERYKKQLVFDGPLLNLDTHDYANNQDCLTLSTNVKNSLAYLMFTSGSTGEPKGVMINHESVVNFIHDIKSRGIFQESSDRIISVTTVAFDIFIFESLVPLCTGHSIYLASEEEQLDPALAAEKIKSHQVTHMVSTVSRIKCFTEHALFKTVLKQFKAILSGGENFPVSLLQDLQQLSQARIYNMYGPTETTVWSTTQDLTHAATVNIGRPIANTQAYIINSYGKLQPVGVYGELCLSGLGLAKGYLNSPEATAAKFTDIDQGLRVYKTGDRARFLETGEIELKGRLDTQIKIRGYRIELSEIENTVLQYAPVRSAAAIGWTDKNNMQQIVLYYCLKGKMYSAGAQERLKQCLEQKLPYYMIPALYIELEDMPFLANGKIDQSALPSPAAQSRVLPRFEEGIVLSKMEKRLLLLWKEVLCVEHVGLQDNFFDLGGNSLGLIQINNKLYEEFGYSIPLLKFFQYPSIAAFVKNLSFHTEECKSNMPVIPGYNEAIQCQEVAVIGLAGKFPGATHLNQFWENVVAGIESVTHFEQKELLDTGIDPKILVDANYVRSKGFLENVEYFDAEFFGYTNADADSMDPQMRLLHQCVWEALENAGYDPFNYAGSIGLFAGSSSNLLWMSSQLKDYQDFFNAFETIILNEKDFMTTRLSHKLNLKGPSVNVQTACSTSLVAIHQAAQAVINGECNMALAGGVSVTFPRKEGYLWHKGLIFSKDGHCKPFSNDASGIIPGNGCGIVLLKRLVDALQDGDHIYGVIKGSAINNDGINKIGFTAPSIEGQSQVIRAALEKSKVSAEQICYLEAHGTGTTLGDPIEIQALKKAWATENKNYCALGSVKANIGHLDAAAGVASFIKTTLTLYNRTLPPLANFTQPNPQIDLANSPFYVNKFAQKIEDATQVLRAGLSSFGIGGTNAHMVLEQPPKQAEQFCVETIHILPFSGQTQRTLADTSKKVLDHLKENTAVKLSDAAWTLQVGRKPLEYRKVLVVQDEFHNDKNVIFNTLGAAVSDSKQELVFYFSGDYKQEKIRELYLSADQSSVSRLFKQTLDACVNTLPIGEQQCFGRLEDNFTPLLHFAAGYALAKTCLDIGIIPKAVVGHGLGEVLALTVANALTLEAAMEIINNSSNLDQILIDKEKYPMQIPKIPLLTTLTNEEQIGLLGTPVFILLGAECIDHASSKIRRPSTCSRDSDIVRNTQILPLLSFNAHNPLHSLNSSIAKIWSLGHNIDWAGLSVASAKRRVPLPTYEFSKQYHNDDIVLSAIAPEPKSFVKKQPEDTEKKQACLMDIWCGLFGKKFITTTDDFFVLGGDSLKASVLTANIQKQLGIDMPLSVVFKHTTFEQMQDWLDSKISGSEYQSIEPLPKRDFYPVSSAQKRMYATHTLLGDSIPYNLAAVYKIEGPLNKERLKKAFDSLVQRHESFRTRFEIKTGEVVQIIEDTLPSVVEFEEGYGVNLHNKILDNIHPFNLADVPLFKVKLIAVNETQHMLLVDLHHIIADQSSIGILIREFADLYAEKPLAPLALQYKDFAVWQNNLFETAPVKKQMMYWQNEFKDGLPVLNMPTDYPRSRVRSYRGERFVVEISEALQSKIEHFAKEQALTPFMIFMAAYKLVLWKYTGQTDFVIGTATAGRTHSDVLNIIGMFVNTLAIRSDIQNSWRIQAYLQHIKEKILLAYENQGCQFEKVVETLNVEKGLSRNPVFDVAINYLEIEGNRELTLEDLVIKPWTNAPVYSKFDITWTIEKHEGRYTADLEYASDLYKRDTMHMFAQHLLHTLAFIVENSESLITDFSLLTPIEQQQALKKINSIEYNNSTQTVVQLFSEQVETYSDRPAIVWENQVLTYREFNQEINKIAALLRVKGVNPGEKIAILLERSLAQIASIFAILKCGCTYVPIDLQYPSARINLILTDSKPSFVLTESRYALSDESIFFSHIFLDKEESFFNGINDIVSFEQFASRMSAKDAAYVMYTSGSTGKPKGVLVRHQNIIQLVKNNNFIKILPSDRVLQISNYAFDGSVFDIFGALLNGACLVLISEEKLIEMAYLTAWIKQQKVSLFYIPTALFNVLIDWDVLALQNVRKILFGGENPSNQHIRKALNHLGPDKLIHVYGPTETTVFSTYYPVQKLEESELRLPIGFPLTHTQLYILDKQGQLLPPNLIGELYIGGKGVTQGYLNRSELTQEKFVSNSRLANQVLYRTGDLVKQLPTGELIFIGREDFQVKIRGFRVELKEIEECIKKIQGVNEAVVTLQKDGHDHHYLAAYFTLYPVTHDKQQNYSPEIIKVILAKQLPEYMIPARIKILSSLPINSNGKIDLKALPEIETLQHNCFPGRSEYQTTQQIILAEAQRILDNPGFTVKDNFFSCGGHSIKAIALIHNLKQSGVHFKVSDIFQYPTVEELSTLYSPAIQPNHESAGLTLPSMSLNLNQIDSLVGHFKGSWKTLNNMISSGRLLSTFRFAPVQVLHAQQSNRLSGFSMLVYGAITEDKLRQVLLQMIAGNQLLHCIPQVSQSKWYEYDISNMSGLIEKSLAYADLSQYMQATQTNIVRAVSIDTLSASYAEDELPWRCSCLRLNQNTHQLIWGFDHVAFDGMSAEILRSQLDKILTSRPIEPIESYADYVHCLAQGPQNVSEQEIITRFNLQEWCEYNTVIAKKLNRKSQKRVDLSIEIALREQNITDPWQFAYDLVLHLLKTYFGIQKIPMGMINYGRCYQDQSFYNCVGEFLDVVPVMQAQSVPDLIDYCRAHAVNFVALLLDPELSHKFPKIAQLLSPTFLTQNNPLKMLGFNFQGFVAKDERKLLRETTQHVSNAPISEFLIVAHYDETHLNISFPCYKKEREQILTAVKTYLTAKEQEVNYV